MNKKDHSYLLGILSCALAVLWVYLIYLGLNMQKDLNTNKIISNQKLVLVIPGAKAQYDKEDSDTNEVINQDKPAPYTSNIALLLDQVEFTSEFTNGIKTLPKEITIGISPYNGALKELVKVVNENGNDIFMELPFVTPNSDTAIKEYDLISTFNTEEIHHRLGKMLNKMEHSVGVYNLGNEEFLNSVNAVSTIVDHLHKANLFFLYGINNKTTVLESDNESVFAVEACDIVIEKNQPVTEVTREFQELEETAQKNGKAIGVIRFDNNNIEMLHKWLKTLEDKKIKLVSIKALPKKIKVSG
jgi:polysaccharide deacetylase 2 family uncharacterized protein YibQ